MTTQIPNVRTQNDFTADPRLDTARSIFRGASMVLLGLLLATARAGAEVQVNALFSDHAVLQRDKPLPVWARHRQAKLCMYSLLRRTRW